jgi:hypothetical protein
MRTFVVTLTESSRPQEVQGDRVFMDGTLKFIRNIEGKQYGDITAAFAPGTWTYFKEKTDA